MARQIIHLLTCLYCLSCSSKADLDDFTKPDLVTVTGTVLNPAPNSKKISLAVTRLGVGQEEIESEIDKEGKFQFQFDTYTPTDVWLIYQTNLLFIVHPGDSVSVEFDGSMPDRPELLETIKFSGDRVTTNNQIAAFQKAYFSKNQDWRKENYAIKNYAPKEFKAYSDTIRSEETNLYNNFLKTHSPNDEAAKWALSSLNRNHFVRMTTYSNSHRMALGLKESEWDVPLSYYDYIENMESVSSSLISADAILDITNWFLYTYIRRLVNEKLTNHPKRDSEYNKDSIFLYTITEHTRDPQFREIAVAQYINDKLDKFSIDAYERNINFIKKHVKEPYLAEPLNKRYLEINQKLKKLPTPKKATIQNINNLADSLIQHISKANKGDVMYVDIWATWCGPCLKEFPYSKTLQEELKNVTFVYICIDSERKAFENTIKRFQLDGQHYFLNETQSKALRKQLNIDGIPHYLLINPDGLIVNPKHGLHPSSDDTKNEIEKLLARATQK